MAPAIDRLEELLAVGTAMMAATRDENNRPHITRAWGGRIDPTTGKLDLALTVSDDLRVISDLEANGAIAVNIVRPTNYLSMQITGVVEWIGDVSPSDQQRIDEHIERFVGEVVAVGMSPSTRVLAGTRFVSIRIAMQQFFEQTPGPKAGTTL